MEVALRDMGFEPSMITAIHDMLELIDTDADHPGQQPHPSKAYIRDTKAMKATPADVIEYPNSYHFVVDMPGLKLDRIKVHLEEGNVLVVAGERKREKDENAKFVRMERRVGKFLKKFILPENADTEKINANYQDGVLTVTVEKTPPPEPKKPKLIQIKVLGQREGEAEQGAQTDDVGRESTTADQAQ